MRRSRALLHLPLISLADGLRIGKVKDIVFDCVQRRIVALVVAEAGWLREIRVVPMDRVRSLGRDAVTVLDGNAAGPASSIKPVRRLVYDDVLLSGLHIFTESGSDLGTIDDVLVDVSGQILGYEISAGVVRDTLEGKRFLPAEETLRAGPDCMIVPDHVEQAILAQPADIVEQLIRTWTAAAEPSTPPKPDEALTTPAEGSAEAARAT